MRTQRVLVLSLLIALGCTAHGLPPVPDLDWRPGVATAAPGESQTIPVDLASILELAGEQPHDIQIAQARAQAAIADHDRAAALWLPRLNPRFDFSAVDGREQASSGVFFDVERQATYAGAGVDLSFDLGEAVFETMAAYQRSRAATLGIRVAQHVNVSRAVDLYYRLLQEQLSFRVAQQAVEHARELVKVEQSRVDAGRGLAAHALRARAHLAMTEGQAAELRALVDQLGAELSALLLLPDTIRLTAEIESVPLLYFAESEESVENLVARARVARPEVRQARALADAAAAAHDQAAHDWLIPAVRLGAAFGGFGATPSRFEERKDFYAGVEWELGFGQAAQARVRAAQSLEANLRVDRVQQRITAAIVSAKARVTAATALVEASAREVQAANAALELVKARHKGGAALLVELLDAERAATAARINQVRAICQHNRAQFELKRQVAS